MATVDRTQSAANERLVASMRAWATVEDRYEPVSDEVVAHQLPELLELAEAFPAQGRRPLLFPPIGGGPAAGRR